MKSRQVHHSCSVQSYKIYNSVRYERSWWTAVCILEIILYLVKWKTYAATERLFFVPFLTDKLNNESGFSCQRGFVFSSRCVHPCDPLRLQASSALQKLVSSFFLPHISSHCTLSILTCLCVCLPSSRPTQWLQSCILKGYAVSLHEAVTLIYTDAAAGLTHEPRLVNSYLLAIGERKSTMVWQIAFSYFSFC